MLFCSGVAVKEANLAAGQVPALRLVQTGPVACEGTATEVANSGLQPGMALDH